MNDFEAWFDSQERTFHTCQFGHKDIAAAAWAAGQKAAQERIAQLTAPAECDFLVTRLRAYPEDSPAQEAAAAIEQLQASNRALTAWKEKYAAALLVHEEWEKTAANLLARAEQAEAKVRELKHNYDELLYCVARKYPGESRHETALRYIRQAEAPKDDQAAASKEPT